MFGVVAMLHNDMASNAEVEVITSSASNEVLNRQFLDARVASTGSNDLGLLGDKSSLGLGERRNLWLRCNGLGGAVDDLSILNKTLDHPVSITFTENTVIDTCLTEIKVAIITNAAVVMLIWDGIAAVVAVDREDAHTGSRGTRVVADSILAVLGNTSKLSKPLVTSSSSASDGNLGAGR